MRARSRARSSSKAKGFVGPAVEAGHPGLHPVPGREHQDGHRRAREPDLATDRETVLDGQHDVQHDRVVVSGRGLEGARLAVGGDVDGVRVLAQALGDQPRGVGLVLDQQDTHLQDPQA
jgi:hypothetical protein